MNKTKLFNRMNDLDMDNIDIVKQLADNYIEWCKWNKAYEEIEVFESKKFESIIVLHSFFDILKAEDGWEFLSDIKYILNEYSNNSQEDYDYMIDFWKEKINGLLKI